MKILFLLISLVLFGCGQKMKLSVISSSKSIDSRLQPYLDRFEIEAAQYGQKYDTSKLTMLVSSELAQTIDKVAGDCLVHDGHPELGQKIRINLHLIENPMYGKDTIEEVIFHELGHCLLNRDHFNATVETTDGYYIYASIMNMGTGNDSNYVNNRSVYIHELFTHEVLVGKYTLIPDKSLPSQFPTEFYSQYN